MTEDEVQAIRRQKLAAWIDTAGGASAICKKRGLPKAAESYISQILSGYSFGGRAARNMEKKLGITEGDLEPTATTSIQSSQVQSARMTATVGPSLGETLKYLSGYLGVLDARSRGRVGQLLKDFAEEPDTHERITTIFQAEIDSGKLKRARKAPRKSISSAPGSLDVNSSQAV